MLKSALARIGNGLLFGIGLGIALAVIAQIYTRWQMAEFDETLFRSFDDEALLVIKSHRPQRQEDNSAFLGQLANEGTDAWSYVEIVVELFDDQGQFIDKCSDHLEGSIGPGKTRNFKVTCPNCRDNPMPKYNTYKIEVVDASYESGKSDL